MIDVVINIKSLCKLMNYIWLFLSFDSSLYVDGRGLGYIYVPQIGCVLSRDIPLQRILYFNFIPQIWLNIYQ